MKARVFILLCVVIGGIVGCGGGPTGTAGRRKMPQKGQITQAELRDELTRFERVFVASLKQAGSDMSVAAQTSRIERRGFRMRVRIIEALHATMASDDPIVAFVDTWSLVTRLRIYLEVGEGSRLYGEQQPIAVNFIRNAESEMIRIAQLFLNQDELEQVQQDLEEFAEEEPITGLYANLIAYPTQDEEDETEEYGAVMRTLRIPMAPIRAMEGVDNTATSIHKVRDSIERFTDVAEQMPESARWQMSILIDDFEESEMTQSFLTSLNDFSQSSTQLVETLDSMSSQLRAELLTVLEESDESQKQLQTTMQTATEAAVQLEKTFGELQNTSQSINETATQATEAAVAWQGASDSIQELVGMFKTDTPRPADAPPSFGMRDFDNMLLNAGQTADKVGNAIAQLQQTVDAAAKEEMQKQLRSLIDHVMWRLFELVLAVVILVSGGLYLIKRLQAAKAVKNE
jgi:gas vesicle protein